jgi:hypothetical protein
MSPGNLLSRVSFAIKDGLLLAWNSLNGRVV